MSETTNKRAPVIEKKGAQMKVKITKTGVRAYKGLHADVEEGAKVPVGTVLTLPTETLPTWLVGKCDILSDRPKEEKTEEKTEKK